MSLSDYVSRTKSVLYGQGLGEKPSIREAAAAASVTVAGAKVTFTLLAGEGAKVKAGHTLSFISENDATKAYVFYVLSVATDTVTALNAYHGAPAIANASTDLDAGFFEQQPLRTEFELHKDVLTVFDTLLWPEAYFIDRTATVTPDSQYGQVDLPANLLEINTAWQIVGGQKVTIPFNVFRNVHTTVSANNVLGFFDHSDLSTIYLSYLRKLVVGDEATDPSDDALVRMVATGAAALALGASVSDTVQERSKKDSQKRGQRDVALSLFRDFITLRQNWGLEDSHDVTEILVERSL